MRAGDRGTPGRPERDGAQVVVAGGGAAGMMAAITAAGQGSSVLLVEPNEKVGRKLYITGKGRCNVTNHCGMDGLMASIPRNGKFLYSSFSRFGPQDTWAFFEALGVKLKVERGERVFPQSDRAADIVDALFYELRRQGVKLCQDRVTGLVVEEGRLTGVRTVREGVLPCGAAILATGGASYPRTGSTGDGYRLAQWAGHTVTPIRGSLVPLTSDDPCCPAMQGLSLRNVELRVRDQAGKVVFQELGELLFTHFGLSGPLVLSASAHMEVDRRRYTAHIDLKPALDEERLDARLIRDLKERAGQNMSTVMGGLLPRSMIPVVLSRSGMPGEWKAAQVRREDRRRLLEELKDFQVAISGVRPVEEAIITAGGVKVNEVEPGTMASKKVDGLYFAGELLDVDGYTGGFNLQIAWSTGYVAGLSAAARVAGQNQDHEERTL